jgi:hypothetical protein
VGVLCIRLILSVFSSDLPGVNRATLNRMILYYRLMTKWSDLGYSTELSRMGLSQLWKGRTEPCVRWLGRCLVSIGLREGSGLRW